MSRMHRTQVLLEPGQHRALARLAQEQGRSISEIIREIIREDLAQRNRGVMTRRRLEALDRIREHREEILRERGGHPLGFDVTDLIDQIRSTRDEEVAQRIEGRR